MMAPCNGNSRGYATLPIGARYDARGSGGGGAALLMGTCCKGNGHVGEGAALWMVHCNGNGRGCAALLMAHYGGNSRGDAVLSIGTCYDGKCSGSGAHGALRRRMTTCRTIAFLLADDRHTNNNQPAMGVDKLDVDRQRPG